jgi:hypothetical protein
MFRHASGTIPPPPRTGFAVARRPREPPDGPRRMQGRAREQPRPLPARGHLRAHLDLPRRAHAARCATATSRPTRPAARTPTSTARRSRTSRARSSPRSDRRAPAPASREVQVTVHRVQGRAFAVEAPGPGARSLGDRRAGQLQRARRVRAGRRGDPRQRGDRRAARHADRAGRQERGRQPQGAHGRHPARPDDRCGHARWSRPKPASDEPATPPATPQLPSTPAGLRLRQDGAAPRVPDPKHAPAPKP